MDMTARRTAKARGRVWYRRLFSVLSLVLRIWPARWRQRQALLDLDDHLLRDIGRTREEARREAGKRFWQ